MTGSWGESSSSGSEHLGVDELGELRAYLRRILEDAHRSLGTYHAPGTGGFAHRVDPTSDAKPSDWSRASTATCVAFLRATGGLGDSPWGPERDILIDEIVGQRWESAGLPRNNAFTTSFLLEALADLGGASVLGTSQARSVTRRVGILQADVAKDGGVELQKFEPTAFLTYKAVSALKRWDRIDQVASMVETWNWSHLYKESVLVASGSIDADVFEVAYSVLIASSVAPLDRMSPQQRGLLTYGLSQFFDAQRADGAWPRSRPLFVYPQLGHAYCFDYELLTAMLSDGQLTPLLDGRLVALSRAAMALDARKYPLKGPGGDEPAPYGWSSGHHGADRRAESWATASALHFCFVLDRLVAEAVRQEAFRYAGVPYSPPRPAAGDKPYIPTSFLDSVVVRDGMRYSLKERLTDGFIEPLVSGRERLKRGKRLPDDVPCAAILYGPPGTSKTELAKHVAAALNWPLLSLDPSHLTRRGLDELHAEANRLFGILQRCEEVVVLLDEFDELVREREGTGELESRFLTTAMLPKLAALSAERRIVYLVATNHLEQFDAAIRRPGRFDIIVPVMPPTAEAKCTKWPPLADALRAIRADSVAAGCTAEEELADLTFFEARTLKKQVLGVQDTGALKAAFELAAARSTMRQAVAPSSPDLPANPSWKDQILAQSDRIRGLGL